MNNKINDLVDRSTNSHAMMQSSEFKLLVEALIRGLSFTVSLLKKARDKGHIN